MPRGSYLINIARGAHVLEAAPWMGRTSPTAPQDPNPENAGAGAVAVATG